jgi:hypothetical protein
MRRYKGERSNGYPNDVKAPDGVAEYGWRLVRKRGTVYFVGTKWQSEHLLPFVGKYVTVKVGDVHCCDVDVFTEYPSGNWRTTRICNIKNKSVHDDKTGRWVVQQISHKY